MTVHGPTGPRGRAPRRTRGRVLVAGAVAVIALGACGGGHGGSLASTPATAATSTPTSSGQGGGSGCGTAATSGSTTLAVTVADRERTVIVHVPTGYGASSKVPLVLNMHGSGSTAAEQEAFTAMDGSADSHGFIVAYPQGLIPEGSGFDWNVPGEPLVGGAAVPAGSADDVTFLTDPGPHPGAAVLHRQRPRLRHGVLGWVARRQPAGV